MNNYAKIVHQCFGIFIGGSRMYHKVKYLISFPFSCFSCMQGSIPAIKLPIIVANIAKGKHGSDSGAYDTEGGFVPEKFEEIFQKHAHTNPNALTSDELNEMLKANQQPNDMPGWLASKTEWGILFDVAKDKDGLLQKDIVRSVYDGSLFYKLEAANKSLKRKHDTDS